MAADERGATGDEHRTLIPKRHLGRIYRTASIDGKQTGRFPTGGGGTVSRPLVALYSMGADNARHQRTELVSTITNRSVLETFARRKPEGHCRSSPDVESADAHILHAQVLGFGHQTRTSTVASPCFELLSIENHDRAARTQSPCERRARKVLANDSPIADDDNGRVSKAGLPNEVCRQVIILWTGAS